MLKIAYGQWQYLTMRQQSLKFYSKSKTVPKILEFEIAALTVCEFLILIYHFMKCTICILDYVNNLRWAKS